MLVALHYEVSIPLMRRLRSGLTQRPFSRFSTPSEIEATVEDDKMTEVADGTGPVEIAVRMLVKVGVALLVTRSVWWAASLSASRISTFPLTISPASVSRLASASPGDASCAFRAYGAASWRLLSLERFLLLSGTSETSCSSTGIHFLSI